LSRTFWQVWTAYVDIISFVKSVQGDAFDLGGTLLLGLN
jgi:hypothetical protein